MGPLRSPAHLLYLVGMVTVYAFATLYPFNWLKNSAVLNQGVATFLESGVLQSHEPPDWVIDGFPKELEATTDKIYTDFNEENGTDYKFQLKK